MTIRQRLKAAAEELRAVYETELPAEATEAPPSDPPSDPPGTEAPTQVPAESAIEPAVPTEAPAVTPAGSAGTRRRTCSGARSSGAGERGGSRRAAYPAVHRANSSSVASTVWLPLTRCSVPLA